MTDAYVTHISLLQLPWSTRWRRTPGSSPG